MASFNLIQISKYILYASNVKRDQMPRSVVSGLVLQCLPTPHKKDAMLIWVKTLYSNVNARVNS